VKAWIMMMLALTLPMAAVGEEAQEGERQGQLHQPEPAICGQLRPGRQRPKLKVYKADISLRVTGDDAAKAVKGNDDPLIRNQLVGLFTQQTSETLGSVEAKEKLRQEALEANPAGHDCRNRQAAWLTICCSTT
jgi:flagellar protein FliL